MWSERREDHQDLIPGVVGSEPELAWPATYFSPAEPGVEVFESCPAAGREVKLLEAHFVLGDLPEPVHQSRSDALVAVCELGLQVVDDPPMGDEGVRVAADNHPSRERPAASGEKYPASLRVKAAGEVVNCGRDVAGVHGGKRESCGATGVSDRDPARGQLLPDRRIGVARVRSNADHPDLGRHPHCAAGRLFARRSAVPDRCRCQRLVIASAVIGGTASLAADGGQAVSRSGLLSYLAAPAM